MNISVNERLAILVGRKIDAHTERISLLDLVRSITYIVPGPAPPHSHDQRNQQSLSIHKSRQTSFHFIPKSSINIVARVHSRRECNAITRHRQLRSGWPPWARLCPWPLWQQLQGHRSLQCRQPGNVMSVHFPLFKLNSHAKAELTSSSASSSPASASSSSRSFPSTSPSSSPPSSSSTSSSGCSVLRFLALGAVVLSQSNCSHDTYIQQCHALASRIRWSRFVLTRRSVFLLYNLLFLGIIVVVASAGSSGFVAFGNVPSEGERKAR
jgi:hypothetical protein